jgi:hypothetical protein
MKHSAAQTIGKATFGTLAAILFTLTPNATACSLPGSLKPMSVSLTSPNLKLGVAALRSEQPEAQRAGGATSVASVTGLWQVTYSTNGAVVDMAFEVFHSDGTEMLNDVTPPAEGNVCLGVWVQTGPTAYKLTHPSWTFDPAGNLTGTAVFNVTLTLTSADAFTGSYTLTYYDNSGTKSAVYNGTMTATRILPLY